VASVLVLYVDDDIVGPHLQLLRNICDPTSASRPHVTVRYFERLSIPKEYLKVRVKYIDLIEPRSFGTEGSDSSPNHTVFIRCKSDDLVSLEHKPHYPTSEFHITLYDGSSKNFAIALLKVLRTFEWSFRVPLPYDTPLAKVEIRSNRVRRKPKPVIYKPVLEEIFYDATSQHLTGNYLSNLSDERRLILARNICEHLRREIGDFHKIESKTASGKASQGKKQDKHYIEPEIHLTPPELAKEITEYAVSLLSTNELPVDFGDPAVGTGAFYSALLQVLPKKQIASAIGIDISAKQVAAAQWRWAEKGMKVIQGDYLHMERLPARSLVLANPPYLRHQRIPAKYKQELRERASVTVGTRISALSGQYVYFLLLSHKWMKPGAIAAWLIPSEFMQTAYGVAIRNYLTHRVQLIRIHQFGHDDPQFENVETLPAVVVFRNQEPLNGQTARLTGGGTLNSPISNEDVQIQDLAQETKWAIPRRVSHKAQSSEFTIGDFFYVRRGIATGANDFFIMERAEAKRLGIPERVLRPVLPKERNLETDIIEKLADGYPKVSPQLCLLNCDLSEAEIRIRYPKLFAYLSKGKQPEILTRYLIRHRHPWYKQEKRDPAPYLCMYMGRVSGDTPPLRFLWNKSDAIATNTYLMLYPRPALNKLLRARSTIAAEMFDLLRETAKKSMSEGARIHAGGLHKIEPRELLEVRLSSSPPWLLSGADLHLDLKMSGV
jgi:adenine-specific DNA-methyltransferase